MLQLLENNELFRSSSEFLIGTHGVTSHVFLFFFVVGISTFVHGDVDAFWFFAHDVQ